MRGRKRPEGVEQRQRSVNLPPETWAMFKNMVEADGGSPATRLGELVERDVIGELAPGEMVGLTTRERQIIWTGLDQLARTIPLRAYRDVAKVMDVRILRDRFADAFDPPRPTLLSSQKSGVGA